MKVRNAEPGFSKNFQRDELLADLLDSAALAFNQTTAESKPILEWVKGLTLGSQPFQVEGHEYEMAILQEEAPRQCFKKGAQVGITETQILKTMHGLIYSRYPQGVLYLFPTQNDVTDFSKGRFGPLLADNPEIEDQVLSTDAVGVKRIRRFMLYLRGARATSKIEGIKRTSSQLKSVPVDRVCFDEVDEMESHMVDLALERLSHSKVKEEAYLSSPSIPGFGVDRLYSQSDQRIWMIRCEACGAETCLELEFPNCLLEMADGCVIRGCKKCKEEIFPRNGRWIAQYPERSKEMVGWWISQLNSVFVDPGKILKAFNDPPNRNLAEVYNSKLAMAYISAENRLTPNDVYKCCGQESMLYEHPGPAALGIDVGKILTCIVGYPAENGAFKIIYLARVSSFNDVHEIARRFNVTTAVVDMEPETRKARDFQAGEGYPVWLCDYQEHLPAGVQWDEPRGLVRVRRTEICDGSHDLITSAGRLILPQRCEEVEQFAKECSNIARVLEEDPESGSREYRYRKMAEDHYRHSLNYFIIAASRMQEQIAQAAWEAPYITMNGNRTSGIGIAQQAELKSCPNFIIQPRSKELWDKDW